MKDRTFKSAISFIIPWLLIFISGLVISEQLHPSARYFTYGLGITSLLTLLLLWWSGTGTMAESAKSILVVMVAISLKMFSCAVLFIYYFHHNKDEIQTALPIGAALFLIYTGLEVYTGLRYSGKSESV